MSVKQAAEALGLHPATIYRLIRDGKLQATEYRSIRRNRFRIPRSEVERLKAGG